MITPQFLLMKPLLHAFENALSHSARQNRYDVINIIKYLSEKRISVERQSSSRFSSASRLLQSQCET